MGARIRIPLRVLLPCLAVSVVATGALVAGVVDVTGARGYLIRRADDALLACATSTLSHRFVAAPPSGLVPVQAPPGACDMELLSASGQLLTPAAPGAGPGPVIPAGYSWLAAHVARPVTVPGAGTGGPWRLVLEAVHYQPQRILYVYGPDDVQYVISGRAGPGPGGVLVLMTGLAGLGRITGRVAAGYAVVAGAVLVLLAGTGLAVTRAIVRPLREAAGLADAAGAAAAGAAAAGELPSTMARRAGPAGEWPSRWPFGPALARTSAQMRASRSAETAARRSAEELSAHLIQVSLDLRTSVSVVRGFAEYCRQRGTPSPPGLDPMMQRAAGEVTRMQARIAGLDACSRRGSTAPDRTRDGRDDRDEPEGSCPATPAAPGGPSGECAGSPW